MSVLRLRDNLASAKTITRSREKTAFVKEVLEALEDGGFAYISHKSWLAGVNAGRTSPISSASSKNGPRYALKPYGVDCKAILLSGDDLEQVAENDCVELAENDVVYAMKQGVNWEETAEKRQ